nr:metallophosphoesterase [Clostridia bacterium]
MENTAKITAPLSASYVRTVSKAGRADGVLTIKSAPDASKEYRAFWANADGALSDYTEFAPIVSSGEETAYGMVPNTLIPFGSDRIIVYGSDHEGNLSEEYVTAMLDEGASDYELGTPYAEFQVQSDIHITENQQGAHNRHFAAVLDEIKRMSPNTLGLFVNGDIGNTAMEVQYDNFRELIKEAGEGAPKVYCAIGNHDLAFSEEPYEVRVANFLRGTANDFADGKAYFDLWAGGLHFIFLGSDKPGCHAYIGEEQCAWLDAKLAENRDIHRPKMVFLHQGLMDTVAGCFEYQKWHGVDTAPQLSAVLKKYPEVMMYSGHSHWLLSSPHTMKLRDENLPTIFNTSAGGYTWNDECNETGKGLVGCEGYYFYVYADKVVARGRDFLKGKWIAPAQFVVEY